MPQLSTLMYAVLNMILNACLIQYMATLNHAVFRIRSGPRSGLDRDSVRSVDPDPDIFVGLKASPVAWTTFREAWG